MKKALVIASAFLALLPLAARASELEAISLGVHLTPAVEATDGRRAWGISLSLAVSAKVGPSSVLELDLLVDSIPSSLGATLLYRHALDTPFTVGAGLNVFWRFETERTLIQTVISSFAHASARGPLSRDIDGEAGLSFPLVTFARDGTEWDVLPLAELPAIHAAGVFNGFTGAAIEGRITLQPVVIDTVQFRDPIGRITDGLLILPTYSAFLHYLP